MPPALGAYLKTWLEPAEPFRIVGPLYYVGTKGLAAYLITTPAGHILLDGGMPDSAEAIEDSIHKLGFDPRDIKFLLITHAHIDHAGTMAHFVHLSGGSAVVMDRDFNQLKSGGKIDPVYGTRPPFYFPEVAAERVLKDWDVLTLGNIKMTALLGAGHTRGATTWVTTIETMAVRTTWCFPAVRASIHCIDWLFVLRIRELPMTSGGHSACSTQ